MSKLVKVVCKCGDWDEENLKVAEITSNWERTGFKWKIFHVLVLIATSAVWGGMIFAKMFLFPKVTNCLSCGDVRDSSDIRSI